MGTETVKIPNFFKISSKKTLNCLKQPQDFNMICVWGDKVNNSHCVCKVKFMSTQVISQIFLHNRHQDNSLYPLRKAFSGSALKIWFWLQSSNNTFLYQKNECKLFNKNSALSALKPHHYKKKLLYVFTRKIIFPFFYFKFNVLLVFLCNGCDIPFYHHFFSVFFN